MNSTLAGLCMIRFSTIDGILVFFMQRKRRELFDKVAAIDQRGDLLEKLITHVSGRVASSSSLGRRRRKRWYPDALWRTWWANKQDVNFILRCRRFLDEEARSINTQEPPPTSEWRRCRNCSQNVKSSKRKGKMTKIVFYNKHTRPCNRDCANPYF